MKPSVSFFPRLLAYLLDKTIIRFIPLIILWSAWLLSPNSLVDFLIHSLWLIYYLIFIAPLFWWLYLSLTTSQLGTTPGKAITGLRIIDEKKRRPNFLLSLFRYPVGYLISSLFFNLGFIWILIDKSHQAWHDMFTGTRVVADQQPRPWLTLGLLTLLLTIQLLAIIKLTQVITTNPIIIRQFIDYKNSTLQLFKNLPKPGTLFIEDINSIT